MLATIPLVRIVPGANVPATATVAVDSRLVASVAGVHFAQLVGRSVNDLLTASRTHFLARDGMAADDQVSRRREFVQPYDVAQ